MLLLDEPLGALDLKLRRQMQLELKAIQHDVGITFIYVTHDQEEAMTMADTIAVMNQGHVEQLGPPNELYERPQTAFVAGFLGVSNLLPGTAAGPTKVAVDGGPVIEVHPEALNGRTGRVAVGIRPEKIRIGSDQANTLSGKVFESAYVGVSTHTSWTRPRAASPCTCKTSNRAPQWPGPAIRSPSASTPRPHSSSSFQRRNWRDAQADPRRTTAPSRARSGDVVHPRPSGRVRRRQQQQRRRRHEHPEARLDAPICELAALHGLRREDEDPTRLSRRSAKKLGVKVDYKEDINSNSEYFGKIQGPLSRGQSINEDIIVLTDNERYLSTMINKKWVEELDKDVIPNIINLVDVQQHPGFDPDRKYSLPWQSGMTGIAYNKTLTKPILSIDQLLEDKSLKGQITVLNGFSDTLGLVMLSNGDDPSKVTDASWKSRDRPDQGGLGQRPDPPVHRKRLRRASRQGRPQGCIALVRATSSSSATRS